MPGRAFKRLPRIAVMLRAALAAAAVSCVPAPCFSDEFVDRASAAYKDIAPAKRSDLVLLPLLAKLDPRPAGLSVERAMLITPASPAFADALKWVQGEPQKAVIAAVSSVTQDENHQTASAWGQPYGVEGVDPDLVIAELYTELGDPPTLANARFFYLRAIEAMECLIHVEATRRTSEDKPGEALDLLLRWTFIARQLIDREFAAEKLVGMQAVLRSLERIRDVAYQDSRAASPALDADGIRDLLKRARDREGLLGVDRIRLPRADRLGAEQLLSRIFGPDGQPSPERFGPTLAQIKTSDRPLRLFAESSKWDVLRATHANARDTAAQLEAVYNDWSRRWDLEPFDPVVRLPSDFEKIDPARFAALTAVLGDIKGLFSLREMLRVQASGTRHALGLYAYRLRQKQWPPDLSAIRPRYVAEIEPDPFSSARRPLEYFVPIRDQRVGPGEEPRPHEIRVFPGGRWPNFSVRVGQEQFVLYSIGPDDRKDGAKDAAAEAGDIVLWPPMLSMVRQHLADTGVQP